MRPGPALLVDLLLQVVHAHQQRVGEHATCAERCGALRGAVTALAARGRVQRRETRARGRASARARKCAGARRAQGREARHDVDDFFRLKHDEDDDGDADFPSSPLLFTSQPSTKVADGLKPAESKQGGPGEQTPAPKEPRNRHKRENQDGEPSNQSSTCATTKTIEHDRCTNELAPLFRCRKSGR